MIKIIPINKSPLLSSTLNPPFLFLVPGELPFLPAVDELVEICSAHSVSPFKSSGWSKMFPITLTLWL